MYLWLKLVHILAVVMFLGNIVTGLFWHKHALRTGDARLIAHAMDGVLRSDRLFTMPGVLVIIASGVFAAIQAGFPIFRTGWILWTLVLFGISGIVFGVRLTPLQRRMRDLAQAGAASGAFDRAAYERLSKQWDLWGAVATLTPLVGLALMVLKPAL
ncbi:MAG TPA: DUF2269 family protein [Steroidobacteraceae bacterium]|jgi:uncharacterized membrane protein|nr:DUF2269 family protein [Steroidobacteraceae bacterium]